MEDLIKEFIAAHREWAGPIVFALAFGESLAFVSILLPATAALVFVGVMIGKGSLEFLPIVLWAVPGAALGDWASYWIGRKFDRAITRVWPFTRNPEMIEKGHAFFERWGVASVFLGKFFGPVRAVVPLVAGMMDMPRGRFVAATCLSSAIWAPYWLSVGVLGDRVFAFLTDRLSLGGAVALLAGAAALGYAAWRWYARRQRA